MKKKLHIFVLTMLFFAVAVGIFLYVWNNKEDIDIYGTYVSEQNKLFIEISNKVISIIETEQGYLQDYLYSTLYNDNMDKRGFENYVENFIENMKNGIEYERDLDTFYFWPVERDAANFSITLLEDDSISFLNKIYEKANK